MLHYRLDVNGSDRISFSPSSGIPAYPACLSALSINHDWILQLQLHAFTYLHVPLFNPLTIYLPVSILHIYPVVPLSRLTSLSPLPNSSVLLVTRFTILTFNLLPSA